MGHYLIKDSDGRLWARAMTRRSAVKLLQELTERMTKQLHIEEEN